MTKRAANSTYRWLSTGVVFTGVLASLIGAQFLQRQDNSAAAAPLSSAAPVEDSTTIHLPAVMDQPTGGNDAFAIELAPIPTVAAPASVPRPRPVARSRSSR